LFPKAGTAQTVSSGHEHKSTRVSPLDDFTPTSLDAFSRFESVEDSGEAAGSPSTRTAQEIYFELVYLAEDMSSTLWIDPLYEGRYPAVIAMTILEARAAGLTSEEIHFALMIGDARGKRKQSSGG
jgi:hypothetical protein